MVFVSNVEFFEDITRLLEGGQTVTFRTKGRSMVPFIVGGRDSVTLRRACGQIVVGDIVLARLQGGRYVLHRVYCKDGNVLTLMGDGNLKATEECRQSDVVGVVTHIVRNGRTVDCTSAAERRRATLWRKLVAVRRVVIRLFN